MTTEWHSFGQHDLKRIARAAPLVAHEPDEAIGRTLWGLECLLRPRRHDRIEYYHYIPLPVDEFVAGLSHCGEPAGRRFLDVGCGIGTKCLLAWNLGWRPTGIELWLPYLDIARRMVPQCSLMAVDANDFTGWSSFDVVYSYRPVVNLDDQDRLNNRIAEQMRPGAYLFAPLTQQPEGTVEIAEHVWQVK